MNEKIKEQASKIALRVEIVVVIAFVGLLALLCVASNGVKGFYRGIREKTPTDFLEIASLAWKVFKKGDKK